MELIHSKINGQLLHIVRRFRSLETQESQREEIVSPDNFIQCAALKMKKGVTFKPHKHIVREVTDLDRIAQESWVVLEGKVKCIFYDLDDTIIATPILERGDASFTLAGGHTYEVLEPALVMEYKTGKYIDQQHDKEFIN
jgi:hypothetical protein